MKQSGRLLAWHVSYSLIEILCGIAIALVVILPMTGGPWFVWLFSGLFALQELSIAAAAFYAMVRRETGIEGVQVVPEWARLNPRACKKSQDERYTAPGRSAADGRLANPVRSGRKQP